MILVRYINFRMGVFFKEFYGFFSLGIINENKHCLFFIRESHLCNIFIESYFVRNIYVQATRLGGLFAIVLIIRKRSGI